MGWKWPASLGLGGSPSTFSPTVSRPSPAGVDARNPSESVRSALELPVVPVLHFTTPHRRRPGRQLAQTTTLGYAEGRMIARIATAAALLVVGGCDVWLEGRANREWEQFHRENRIEPPRVANPE